MRLRTISWRIILMCVNMEAITNQPNVEEYSLLTSLRLLLFQSLLVCGMWSQQEMNGLVIISSSILIVCMRESLKELSLMQLISVQEKQQENTRTITSKQHIVITTPSTEDGPCSLTMQTQLQQQVTWKLVDQPNHFGIKKVTERCSINTCWSTQELPLTTLLTLDPGTLKDLMLKSTSLWLLEITT